MTEFDAGSKVAPHRARRMLAALIGGVSPDDIGAEENLPTRDGRAGAQRRARPALGRRRRPISQKSRSRGSRASACS